MMVTAGVDEAFRAEAKGWLADHVVGEFASLRGRGGPGDEARPAQNDRYKASLAWIGPFYGRFEASLA